MTRGRLTNQGREIRDRVEDALFDLNQSADLQDEAILRIQQAIGQTEKVYGVLNPALDRLSKSQSKMHRAKGFLEWLWIQGKDGRWEDDQR